VAVTFVLAKVTVNELAYLVSHDGAGGNAVVIDNAQMVADLQAAALGGPLFEVPGLVVDGPNPNSTALARQHMLGDASGLASQVLANVPHCCCSFIGRNSPGGGTLSWDVDADVDGVTGSRYELNILATPAAGSSALLRIHFQHTYVR